MVQTSRFKRTIAVGLVAALALGTAGILPVTAEAKDKNGMSFQVPVTGTTSNGGTFEGTATISGFAVEGKNVVAVGTVSGVVNGAQSFVSTFSAPVSMPSPAATAAAAPQAAAACQILNLTLGPLNLNILGLVISIPNPIVLNITAVPGAGNLLGNLLCSVANLLNGGGALQQVADLLNQILNILNGL